MAQYERIKYAANKFSRSTRTIEGWLGKGYIRAYRRNEREIFVDIEEIERALITNPHMRDGRKPYGQNVIVVPMPMLIEDAAEHEAAEQ